MSPVMVLFMRRKKGRAPAFMGLGRSSVLGQNRIVPLRMSCQTSGERGAFFSRSLIAGLGLAGMGLAGAGLANNGALVSLGPAASHDLPERRRCAGVCGSSFVLRRSAGFTLSTK